MNYYGFDWAGVAFGLASIHLGQRRRVGFVLHRRLDLLGALRGSGQDADGDRGVAVILLVQGPSSVEAGFG